MSVGKKGTLADFGAEQSDKSKTKAASGVNVMTFSKTEIVSVVWDICFHENVGCCCSVRSCWTKGGKEISCDARNAAILALARHFHCKIEKIFSC